MLQVFNFYLSNIYIYIYIYWQVKFIYLEYFSENVNLIKQNIIQNQLI